METKRGNISHDHHNNSNNTNNNGQDAISTNMHPSKINYTKEVLLNLKPKSYIAKIDIDTCNCITKLENKMQFQKEKRRVTKIQN